MGSFSRKGETMMLQEEAVERAWACIRSRGTRVTGVESVRRVTAGALPEFNWPEADLWIVLFALPTEPNRFSLPNVVVLEVDDTTGEATIVPGL
jgi:hypothetical protein